LLGRGAADAANPNEGHTASRVQARQFFGGKLQHGPEQAVGRVADGELGRVHAHGHAARAGGRVIA